MNCSCLKPACLVRWSRPPNLSTRSQEVRNCSSYCVRINQKSSIIKLKTTSKRVLMPVLYIHISPLNSTRTYLRRPAKHSLDYCKYIKRTKRQCPSLPPPSNTILFHNQNQSYNPNNNRKTVFASSITT